MALLRDIMEDKRVEEVRTQSELKEYMSGLLIKIDPDLKDVEINQLFLVYEKDQKWEGTRMVTGATYQAVDAFVRTLYLLSEFGCLLEVKRKGVC